jgi:hypothetical protein
MTASVDPVDAVPFRTGASTAVGVNDALIWEC